MAGDKNNKYIGKVKNQKTQYGNMQKIMIDNPNATKEDGSENTFFQGALVWMDKDGKMYQVKQMTISVPKDGMKKSLVDLGYVANVVVDLNNEYDATLME
jgi:hypothetical protein